MLNQEGSLSCQSRLHTLKKWNLCDVCAVKEADVKSNRIWQSRRMSQKRDTHRFIKYALQQHTLMTVGTAFALLGDGQGAWWASRAGSQITSHLGITAFTFPATAISPSGQVLKKRGRGK